MKIWIINHYAIPPSMGGLVRHYYFSKYLQKKGHKVQIFTSSKIHNTDVNMVEGKELYKKQKVDGITYTFVKTSDYKGNGIKRIINMLEFPIRMWRVQRYFEKPDVIYTSSPDLFTALSAILLAKFLKLPCVVEVRDLWPESIVEYNGMSRKNLLIQILYQLEKWIYIHADQLIFTMSGVEEYLKEKGWLCKIEKNKIHYINNGIDLEEFDYNREHYKLEDIDLDNDETFKVLFMGSVRKVYHLDFLVDVAKELKRRGLDKIKILIYGDGTEREQLVARCKRENIDTIIFKGRIEKKYVASVLDRGDLNLIHLQKSSILKYGCSWNKLFEYMASGKPILSTVNINNSKDLKKGITKIVSNVSVDKVCDAIVEIWNLSEEEKRKAGSIARFISKEYSYAQLTKELIKVIEK